MQEQNQLECENGIGKLGGGVCSFFICKSKSSINIVACNFVHGKQGLGLQIFYFLRLCYHTTEYCTEQKGHHDFQLLGSI